jgi:hypothetical protein
LTHVEYDWSIPGRLDEALANMRGVDVGCAVSSEGGLFEHGSDADIHRTRR